MKREIYPAGISLSKTVIEIPEQRVKSVQNW